MLNELHIMVANNKSNATTQNEIIGFIIDKLNGLETSLKEVGGTVSDIKIDVAVIKTQSAHMLKIINDLNTDHEAHKKQVKEALENHEKRLDEVEKNQNTWKNYITLLASVAVVLCSLVTGGVVLYKNIHDIAKEEIATISEDENGSKRLTK